MSKKKRENLSLYAEDVALIHRQAKALRLSNAGFIRMLIHGYRPKAFPDNSFRQFMEELSVIGDRMQELSAKADALHLADASVLQEETARWHAFQTAVLLFYSIPEEGKP